MGVGARTVPAQQADDKQAGEHADRRMPTEHPPLQEKCATGQKGQVDPFHAASAEMAKRRIAGEEFVHGQAFVDAQAVQRSGLSPGVWCGAEVEAEYLLQGAEQVHAVGGRPVRHLLGKGHQHQGETEHRRVERVLAYAAI